MSGERIERESKFVLSGRPNIELSQPQTLRAAYLPLDVPDVEARLRYEGDEPILTFKAKTSRDVERAETEPFSLSANPSVAEQLYNASTARIEKTRYRVADPLPHGSADDCGYCEVDQYHGALEGRWTLEREFASADDQAAYQPPVWAQTVGCHDVTADKRYKNKSLAEHGWPED